MNLAVGAEIVADDFAGRVDGIDEYVGAARDADRRKDAVVVDKPKLVTGVILIVSGDHAAIADADHTGRVSSRHIDRREAAIVVDKSMADPSRVGIAPEFIVSDDRAG